MEAFKENPEVQTVPLSFISFKCENMRSRAVIAIVSGAVSYRRTYSN